MHDVTKTQYVCVPPEDSKLSILELTDYGAEVAYILCKQGYEVYRVTTTWEKLGG